MNDFLVHPAMAIPLILVGWLGFSMRKTALGGTISAMILWQGVLAFAALAIFQTDAPAEGAILLWFFGSTGVMVFSSLLVLGLRHYYAKRSVKWDDHKEIRH